MHIWNMAWWRWLFTRSSLENFGTFSDLLQTSQFHRPKSVWSEELSKLNTDLLQAPRQLKETTSVEIHWNTHKSQTIFEGVFASTWEALKASGLWKRTIRIPNFETPPLHFLMTSLGFHSDFIVPWAHLRSLRRWHGCQRGMDWLLIAGGSRPCSRSQRQIWEHNLSKKSGNAKT